MSVCDNCGNKVYCEADDQWCGERVKELSKEIERLKKQALTEDVVECENCLTGMTGGTITRDQFGDLVNELRIKSIKFNYCPICGKELSYLW